MAEIIVTDATSLTPSLLVGFLRLLQQWPTTTVLLLITLRFLFRRYTSPLRKYPGPFLASGTRLYSLIVAARGHIPDDHIRLHQQYGPVVRIQPNQLSFASPEAARQILSPGRGFHKTDFYWVFPPPGNPDIFTEVREDVHATKKRFVTQPFSLASFEALAPCIDQTIARLIKKLDCYGEVTASTVDLGKILHFFAFDVLGEVAFSSSFGFVEQEKDVDGAIAFIDSMQHYDGIIGQIPWLDYLLRRSPLWEYLPFVTSMANNHITRTALFQMTARADGTAVVDRRDLLSQLFEAHQKNPEKFDLDSVFAVSHGAIGAGSDSTASTMQTFMWNVLTNISVYEKLTEEVLTADQNGQLGKVVAWKESQKYLPYFQACLKEAMRVGPAVGFPMYRKVPRAGAMIDGVFVPGGVEVAVNAHVLHKDKAIFGDDADLFRPERWLVEEGDEKGAARTKNMDRYMFQFGGGSHVCIGRNLALLEINKVLPQILRRYKLELAYPGRPMKKHVTFFVVQEGLEVKIAKR